MLALNPQLKNPVYADVCQGDTRSTKILIRNSCKSKIKWYRYCLLTNRFHKLQMKHAENTTSYINFFKFLYHSQSSNMFLILKPQISEFCLETVHVTMKHECNRQHALPSLWLSQSYEYVKQKSWVNIRPLSRKNSAQLMWFLVDNQRYSTLSLLTVPSPKLIHFPKLQPG